MSTPAGLAPDIGTVTHEGVQMFTNTMTSEDLRSGIDAAEKAAPAAVDTPVEKRPNPRKDLAARVAQQSGELANKDQALSTLNERLAEIDTLKQELAALKAAPKAEPVKTAAVPHPVAEGFTDAEPVLDQFAASDDPYRDYMRALSRYDRRKETFEAKQEATQSSQVTELKGWVEQGQQAHDTRLSTFMTANPTAKDALMAAAELPLSKVMYVAIERSDRGPEMMLALAENPDLADELMLQTRNESAIDAQRHFNPLVAVVQRRLLSRVPAAVAGSAVPVRKTTQAHPPINPVSGSHASPTTGPPDPHTSTQEEFNAYWNQQDREARQAGRRR